MLERFLKFILLSCSLIIPERPMAHGFPSDSIGLKISGDHTYVLHRVEKDENLFRLSLRYQVRVKDIVRLNPGSEKMIRIGEKLRIPYQNNNRIISGEDLGSNRPGFSFQTTGVEILSTDSLNSKAVMHLQDEKRHEGILSGIDHNKRITEKKEKKMNDPVSESGNGRNLKHEVTWGETVYSIAKRYHVATEDISGWNRLEDNRIYSGQELVIWPGEDLEVDGSGKTGSKNKIPNFKTTTGDIKELNEYDHKPGTSPKNTTKAVKLKENLSMGDPEKLNRVQFKPLPIEYQLAIIFVATRGYLDSVPVNRMTDFEKEYIDYMKSQHTDVLVNLREGVLDERSSLIMRDVALDLADNYQ